jgi:hypothetical protein
MWNQVSNFLATLSHHVMNLPAFHWFRIGGGGLALACSFILLLAYWRGGDSRWETLIRVVRWTALGGLALWIFGWIVGELVVLAVVLAGIACIAFVVHEYLHQNP